MKISVWISTCLVLATALGLVVAVNADSLEHLKKYEDKYQIVKGDFPECPAQLEVVRNEDKTYWL